MAQLNDLQEQADELQDTHDQLVETAERERARLEEELADALRRLEAAPAGERELAGRKKRKSTATFTNHCQQRLKKPLRH